MTPDQIEKLIQSVQAFSKCPKCNSQYQADQIRIREETHNTCLLEMHCLKCNTKTMGTVLIYESANAPDSKPRQIKTKNKRLRIPNSQDQVLEFHQFLKKFDGNFRKIFHF